MTTDYIMNALIVVGACLCGRWFAASFGLWTAAGARHRKSATL